MRTVLYAVPLALLAALGCLDQQTLKGPTTNAVSPPAPRPVRLVTADEVTEQNAHQKSQALREEIEQAQRDLPPGALAVPEAPKR